MLLPSSKTVAKMSYQKSVRRTLEENFITLLQSSENFKQILQIQNQIITHGFEQNEYLVPKMVMSCSRFKKMGYARQLFDKISQPNVVLFSTMFKGYFENEFYTETLILLNHMRNGDIRPNAYTFPFVLKSCGKLCAWKEGLQVHSFVIKSGFLRNIFVNTTLIEMYRENGEISLACQLYDEMPERNIVALTAIISGYISLREVESARRLFDQTDGCDLILWDIMISAYVSLNDMKEARNLFDRMPDRDVMAWNTILLGYMNNEEFVEGEKVFNEMPKRNIFSWNGMIGGYFRNNSFLRVLGTFNRMITEGQVEPNDVTLVTVLSACARLGALDLGKWVHIYAKNNGFMTNIYLGNGLIDMYAKCGSINNALDVFNSMNTRDLVSWNCMINGLAMHGRGIEALQFYKQMRELGQDPDGITFIGVLCACSHLGLVNEGFAHFRSMMENYSIKPHIEHYGCVVDLLGRAGLLLEAFDFVRKMPMEADCVIWSALLGASRIHKDTQLAEYAIEQLIRLEPKNVTNYVELSNIYGEDGKWEDVARLKKLAIREVGVRKLPGCSLIEVNDEVFEFHSSDKRHAQTEEIHEILRILTEMLKITGHVPVIHDLVEAFDGE